ncbi:unnamed protein product [Bursaphelenchus xylophilus]|uniref:(pine wood nematode) hypothetical protein n=1 Tax=Bursaphelenchus xylophilus TaxID=6326 RepID=A0A1I7SE10_BURXY|nr:unnamed protein product [Bursaphelenchus xylophilus]CAG9113116.1 unnamed protein product [Bursaphelenchus xylophilus]
MFDIKTIFIFILVVLSLPIGSKTLISESLFFQIDHPESLQYAYEFLPSYQIGVRFPSRTSEMYMILADPIEACEPLKNDLDVADNVVLVERGTCSFVDKALNVERAGGKIIMITDSKNGTEGFIDMIKDETGTTSHIPAGYLPGNNGRRMREYLNYEGDYIKIRIPFNYTTKRFRENLNKPPWELW